MLAGLVPSPISFFFYIVHIPVDTSLTLPALENRLSADLTGFLPR